MGLRARGMIQSSSFHKAINSLCKSKKSISTQGNTYGEYVQGTTQFICTETIMPRKIKVASNLRFLVANQGLHVHASIGSHNPQKGFLKNSSESNITHTSVGMQRVNGINQH